MDLRAKLARLRTMEPPAALFEPPPVPSNLPSLTAPKPWLDDAQPLAPGKAERIAQLRALIGEIAARDRRRAPALPSPPAGPPPWSEVPTEHGPLYVCERYLEPDHHHGRSAVRAGLHAGAGTLSALLCDPALGELDLDRALYLDTETTGLAGGTGTVAFLVGLARFEEGALCVEQLIVPQLGSETPVLARLAQRLANASCLITYNGKSFDWPLLRTRFVLSRLPVPSLPTHIDLLHVCRRLWKERLSSVRLTDMEREILHFEREDDLPGAEIPARYFEFLRGGSPDRLCPVLEHNQNDLIALAALLGAVSQLFEGSRGLCDPADALYFGKLALRARDFDRARSFGEEALLGSDCQHKARAALTFCAEIELKLGRIPQAIAFLHRALEAYQPTSAVALPVASAGRAHLHRVQGVQGPVDSSHEALAVARLHFSLAKLYEHDQHDVGRALRHARNTEPVEGPALHGRRLGRLYRRLLRGGASLP